MDKLTETEELLNLRNKEMSDNEDVKVDVDKLINLSLNRIFDDPKLFTGLDLSLYDYSIEAILLIILQYKKANNLKHYTEWKELGCEIVDKENILINVPVVGDKGIGKKNGYLFDIRQVRKENNIPTGKVVIYDKKDIINNVFSIFDKQEIRIEVMDRYELKDNKLILPGDFDKDLKVFLSSVISLLINEGKKDDAFNLAINIVYRFYNLSIDDIHLNKDVDKMQVLEKARVMFNDIMDLLNSRISFDYNERLILNQVRTEYLKDNFIFDGFYDFLIKEIFDIQEKILYNKIVGLNEIEKDRLVRDISDNVIYLNQKYSVEKEGDYFVY